MKKCLLLFLCSLFLVSVSAKKIENDKYRRNSLLTFFITDCGVMDKSAMSYIDFACQNYEVSDKFNQHEIKRLDNTIRIKGIQPTQKDRAAVTKSQKGIMGVLNGFSEQFYSLQPGMKETYKKSLGYTEDNDEVAAKLNYFVRESKIANILIAKWFNMSPQMTDGSHYNMELIQERGLYSATELEKLRANETIRGTSILKDAGMELLSHTYITFTYFSFETSQEADEKAKDLAKDIFGTKTVIGKGLQQAGNRSIKENSGYYVMATTFLFRLKWNDETEESFIAQYYNAPAESLLNSNEFEMEYVGWQESPRIKCIKNTGKGKAGNTDLAKEATIQTIDASLGNLQRKFEDFRVKAPLIDVSEDAITAYIGTKEGITKDSEFEVLERVYNEKKNKFSYNKVGKLKIDKMNPICDNVYRIGQAEPTDCKTFFKGKVKNLAPGMLIRQIK